MRKNLLCTALVCTTAFFVVLSGFGFSAYSSGIDWKKNNPFSSSETTPVQKNSLDSVDVMQWGELLPYIGCHTGIRAKDGGRVSFNMGADFCQPFPENLDPKIDALVVEILSANKPLMASILRDLVPGILDHPDRDAQGNKLRYTDEQIQVFSKRLWQVILDQDPPVVQTHLKFLFARELEGKIQIAGMDFKPTLSNKSKLKWKEVEPYVASFLKINSFPREVDGQPMQVLGYKICMGDNHIFDEMTAEEVDWRLAIGVFNSLWAQSQSNFVFSKRIEAIMYETMAELNINEKTLTQANTEERAKQLQIFEQEFHRKLQNDYSFTHTVKGFLAYHFESADLPPLVN